MRPLRRRSRPAEAGPQRQAEGIVAAPWTLYPADRPATLRVPLRPSNPAGTRLAELPIEPLAATFLSILWHLKMNWTLHAVPRWFANVLRTPQRPRHPVFHRDVGTLHLLRDAGPAGAFPRRRGRKRWLRTRRQDRDRDLRALHGVGIHGSTAGGLDRGSADRRAARGDRGRRLHDHRQPDACHSRATRALLLRPGRDRARRRA